MQTQNSAIVNLLIPKKRTINILDWCIAICNTTISVQNMSATSHATFALRSRGIGCIICVVAGNLLASFLRLRFFKPPRRVLCIVISRATGQELWLWPRVNRSIGLFGHMHPFHVGISCIIAIAERPIPMYVSCKSFTFRYFLTPSSSSAFTCSTSANNVWVLFG